MNDPWKAYADSLLPRLSRFGRVRQWLADQLFEIAQFLQP